MNKSTPIPEFAEFWTVDEVAECLPGMSSSGAYQKLWSFVEDGLQPTLDEVWSKLSTAHQQAIIDGYAKEFPGADQ